MSRGGAREVPLGKQIRQYLNSKLQTSFILHYRCCVYISQFQFVLHICLAIFLEAVELLSIKGHKQVPEATLTFSKVKGHKQVPEATLTFSKVKGHKQVPEATLTFSKVKGHKQVPEHPR